MTPAQAPGLAHLRRRSRTLPARACRPRCAGADRELALIADCGYEMYFLTVHDIVRYARSVGILCQGAARRPIRWSASAWASPTGRSGAGHLLFERFISKERREPPDIDVDFEHDRREEVIQYIYGKYGRDRAAIAAVVIQLPHAQRPARRGQGPGLAPGGGRCLCQRHHWFDDAWPPSAEAPGRSLGQPATGHRPPACGWSWSRRTS